MAKTIAVVLALAALACAPPPVVSAQPVLQPDLVRTLNGWMECEECTDAQLQAVARYGQPAIAPLADLLRNGPPSTAIAEREKAMRDRYKQQVRYAQTHPESKPPRSEDDTVARYTANYRLSYRVHAAQALKAIGTPEARAALTQVKSQASALKLTAAEVAAIDRALQ